MKAITAVEPMLTLPIKVRSVLLMVCHAIQKAVAIYKILPIDAMVRDGIKVISIAKVSAPVRYKLYLSPLYKVNMVMIMAMVARMMVSVIMGYDI